MKNKNIILIIGAVVVILLMVQGEKEVKKVIGESIARNLPVSVAPGQQTTITLTAMGTSGNYFAIVRDNIPSGWTYVSGGAQEGTQVKGIVSSLTGGSMTYILQAPDSIGTATFSGTYQFTNQDQQTTGGDTQLSISEATYSCIGTIPQNANLCTGDDESLTQNTPITLVDSCGTPKCEFICYSGYQKEGDICVVTDCTPSTCASLGYECGTHDDGCGGSTGSCGTCPIGETCTNGQCESIPELCGNGVIDIGEECDGTNLGGKTCADYGYTSGALQCDNTCKISTILCTGVVETCEERLDCDIWETCNEAETKCKLAGWVYLVGALFGFVAFTRLM